MRTHAQIISVMLVIALAASCQKPAPPAPQRLHLKGKVVSVDKESSTAVIDHEAIPGFMSAMTMPYTVKPANQLDQLAPGDSITADVVVQDHVYWLENVAVTQHGATPPKPAAAVHIPSAGEVVPDFQLVNQDGRHIWFHQYRGKVLLVTFIYTGCPFADYCPRVSSEFAKINRQLEDAGKLSGKVHLLSISFDPQHDTAKVLRDYGFACAGRHDPQLFHQWEFAAAPATDLPKIADFFGLSYQQDGGFITHSLSTTVIGPDGKIFRWYHGNKWQAADLLKDAADLPHS